MLDILESFGCGATVASVFVLAVLPNPSEFSKVWGIVWAAVFVLAWMFKKLKEVSN